ncbi:ribose ABC transporter permease [Litorilinea aerophila]|uniref:Ribose ABC transporter permease n=1 Tax=Litorilinea aerophila TaxID=1204385 RepID=A0A540VNH7_9CHLR|nr:ribose ABC transporter permease [Litorilinea aerophila]MCC9074929.1 ribose ABC transporter permease [Litorilinea aerophila]
MTEATATTPTGTWHLRGYLQRFGILISFLLLCLALSLLSDRFLTVSNLTNVLRQITVNGIIAVGMTYVILIGDIDLSVGSVLALTSVVTADLLQMGVPVPMAILLGIGLGMLLGTVNGLITVGFQVPSFITTLGMLTAARGMALTYTQGRPITGLPDSFRFLGRGEPFGMPMPIILAVLVFALAWVILRRTRYGEQLYAIGNNPVAARLVGIPVNRFRTLVFTVSGGLSALAGMILIARLDSAQPTAGVAFELDAIAAVVLGGTRFTGGVGGMGGTLLGALIIGVLDNGLNLLNISSLYEQLVKGAVIALALLIHRQKE